ncbi:nuclear transport factor 2 family protein [Cryptosporangium minutisporangium]|uniref:nuclear transport factor 2 family protein n=1 Tax=Cryptosporangium minutisporangium TaxID=113569 RepID=UPI0031E7C171
MPPESPYGLSFDRAATSSNESNGRTQATGPKIPEIRIQQPASLPHGGEHSGLDGVRRMGSLFAEHWDRTIDEPRIHGCGGTVVQVTTQTWTAKQSGRVATVDVVELFGFTDGLISEIRVFPQDTHALLSTLGSPNEVAEGSS